MSGATISTLLPVLIVEDEPSVMAYIRTALERAGYDVCGAQSGADALKLLAEHEFSGIISDMRTPGGVDGADVFSWLREHRPALTEKLIFITGDTASDDTSTILKQTGAPCIEKPFRVHQLIEMVAQTIGSAK